VRQRLGQHFLRDPKVVQTIVSAAGIGPTDEVLEIGPGKAVLTDALLPRARSVTAVELDRQLAAALQKRIGAPHRILQADFLKVDLEALFPGTGILKVVGNLPYAITSPIFEKLLAWPRWNTGVFLIQREVAERIKAPPGSRTYGVLSLAVQLFADAETVLHVKPGAFKPPPQVHSSVLRLRRRDRAALPPEQIPSFFDLVHGSFAHRRKTIANSLAFHSGKTKEEIENWLRQEGFALQRRAETFSLEEFVRLTGKWAVFRRQTSIDTR
jgi:16S rRNA (adenine1518-N6/adenine1519-N6)-dimethyltransferase